MVSDLSRNLIILRHGETDGNAQRVVQTPDTPLNARGLDQAERAARRIVEQFGDSLTILSSDYRRAHQTAEAVAARAHRPVTLDQALRERNFGDLRGRSYDELRLDPFAVGYHPPGGESWEQFFRRIDQRWCSVPSLFDIEPGNTVVLVTHGLVCRGLLQRHLGGDPEQATWANTCLTTASLLGESWSVDLLACIAHLEPSQNDDGLIAGL